jgi:hypothetical protein
MQASAVSAGASPDAGPGGRGRGLRRNGSILALALLLATTLGGGCSRDSTGPQRLLDGSEASAPPVELEEIDGPAVLTKVRLVDAAAREGTLSASCLERGWGLRPTEESVERIGVSGASVTFREAFGRGVFGCDASTDPRESAGRWCGGAYGQLYDGRLRDPRLGLGCRTEDDGAMAFLWVDPGSEARYVAVQQPGYVEVYEVAARLPVRIATTTGLERDPLGVTVEVSEHDSTGRLLVRRRIEAMPAG